MKQKIVSVLFVILFPYCSPTSEFNSTDYKIITEAYHSGHLTIVSSILKEIRNEREFSQEEAILYSKTLFYLGEWREFFKNWPRIPNKTPEMILLYFKAVLISKLPIIVSPEDESNLLALLPVSPEACLLYLKLKKSKHPHKQKKIFLAQWKQFQTQIDRLNKELVNIK